MYHHTVLVPKTLTFHPEYEKCPDCGQKMEKHIVCEGARFHVLSWGSDGKHCSAPNCEYNHHSRHYHERRR